MYWFERGKLPIYLSIFIISAGRVRASKKPDKNNQTSYPDMRQRISMRTLLSLSYFMFFTIVYSRNVLCEMILSVRSIFFFVILYFLQVFSLTLIIVSDASLDTRGIQPSFRYLYKNICILSINLYTPKKQILFSSVFSHSRIVSCEESSYLLHSYTNPRYVVLSIYSTF